MVALSTAWTIAVDISSQRKIMHRPEQIVMDEPAQEPAIEIIIFRVSDSSPHKNIKLNR